MVFAHYPQIKQLFKKHTYYVYIHTHKKDYWCLMSHLFFFNQISEQTIYNKGY